jgi:hypothetical protein
LVRLRVHHAIDRRYFFADGLYFRCQRCGRCCRGEPGVVRVSAAELAALSAHLGVSVADLTASWSPDGAGGHCVPEKPGGDCLFWRDGPEPGCAVYPVRPRQCATFPFWLANLRSKEGWDAAAAKCPGMNTGERYDLEAILRLLEAELAALPAREA